MHLNKSCITLNKCKAEQIKTKTISVAYNPQANSTDVKMTNVLLRLLINKVNRMKKRCLKVVGWKGRPLEKLKRSGKKFIYGKGIDEAELV